MVHTDLVRPITRYARTVREPALVLQELDEAVSRAFGQGGEPGPVYLDFPTDTLRAEVPLRVQLDEHFRPKPPALLLPESEGRRRGGGAALVARRPLVITGRARAARGPSCGAFSTGWARSTSTPARAAGWFPTSIPPSSPPCAAR